MEPEVVSPKLHLSGNWQATGEKGCAVGRTGVVGFGRSNPPPRQQSNTSACQVEVASASLALSSTKYVPGRIEPPSRIPPDALQSKSDGVSASEVS